MIEPNKALHRFPLFALLPAAWLDPWVLSGELHTIEAGQTLFTLGSAGTHVHLILAGKVRVLRPGSGKREISMGILSAGEVFGEYALLQPGLNTATCRAAEAGQVLRLPLPPLRQHITELLEGRSRLKDWLRLHYVLAHLRDRPSLGFMSATSFLPLLERFQTVRFRAGNTIQTEGLHDDGWFVIQSGRAGVLGKQNKGEELMLEVGDCFGEAGLLGPAGVPTVQALSEVECLVLRRTALDRPEAAASRDSIQTIGPAGRAVAQCHEWVAQRDDNDCGVAALAMAARAHGQHHSVEALREHMHVQQQGVSLQQMQRMAVQMGFRTRAVRIGLDHLAAVRLPAIAHLRHGHYVTLFEVNAGNVLVGDPAEGVGRWNGLAFQKNWSGELLLLLPA